MRVRVRHRKGGARPSDFWVLEEMTDLAAELGQARALLSAQGGIPSRSRRRKLETTKLTGPQGSVVEQNTAIKTKAAPERSLLDCFFVLWPQRAASTPAG